MHNTKSVSIVIPVYNSWHLVQRNIDSIILFENETFNEIIIVDDASPEICNLSIKSDKITIIRNDKNLGYTGTVNKGLKIAQSEIILLLDSDAYLIRPIIKNVLDLYNNSSIGCIGFSTVSDLGMPTGSYCIEPSVIGLIAGQQLEAKFGYLRFWGYKRIMPYSCSVSFRKECLEDVNYFDQYLFPVLDADIDLSIRIHESRWSLIHSKDIIISHQGGNSYKINYKRVLLFYKSRWTLFIKHNRMKKKSLVRFLIISRLKCEKYLLFFASIIFPNNNRFNDLLTGRRVIINELNSFYKQI